MLHNTGNFHEYRIITTIILTGGSYRFRVNLLHANESSKGLTEYVSGENKIIHRL